MVSIRHVTPLARQVHALVTAGSLDAATKLLPQETPYPPADAPMTSGALERQSTAATSA
ncbi:hypothetical protein GA0115234_1104153 [Streptomyces sp. DvalAA-43]|nr:hypothetical protein GA0115234_1104153 [Streptomyces sp. DvalAA-43]